MKLVLSKTSLLIFTLFVFGWADSQTFSLYSDRRGRKVGDIVTVLVVESAKASNKSGTRTEKEQGVKASASKGNGLLDFIPSLGFGAGASANYKGQGKTDREGTLKAKVTARIVKVLDNGNFVIEGSKIVEINSGREILKVSGIIRAEDIGRSNTVFSYNIADAKIVYTGNGSVYTGQRPGMLARFFSWLF